MAAWSSGNLREPDPAPGRPKAPGGSRRLQDFPRIWLSGAGRLPLASASSPECSGSSEGARTPGNPLVSNGNHPGSPQTYPGTQESIGTPQAPPDAPEKKWSFIMNSCLWEGPSSGNLLSSGKTPNAWRSSCDWRWPCRTKSAWRICYDLSFSTELR